MLGWGDPRDLCSIPQQAQTLPLPPYPKSTLPGGSCWATRATQAAGDSHRCWHTAHRAKGLSRLAALPIPALPAHIPDPAGIPPAPCTHRCPGPCQGTQLSPLPKSLPGVSPKARLSRIHPGWKTGPQLWPCCCQRKAPSGQSRAAAGAARARSVLGQNKVEEPPLRKGRAQRGTSRGGSELLESQGTAGGRRAHPAQHPGTNGLRQTPKNAEPRRPHRQLRHPRSPPASCPLPSRASLHRDALPEPAPDLLYRDGARGQTAATPRDGCPAGREGGTEGGMCPGAMPGSHDSTTQLPRGKPFPTAWAPLPRDHRSRPRSTHVPPPPAPSGKVTPGIRNRWHSRA